jgi:hypothetical protein
VKTTLLWIVLAVLTAATLAACNTRRESISEFPLPGEISNFTKLSDEMLTFETNLSLDDTLAFYQDILSKKGYTERTNLTFTNETAFGLAFDGHASGKEIIIQSADLGGTTTVTIRLRDID